MKSRLKSRESIYTVICKPETTEQQVIMYYAPSTPCNVLILDFDEDEQGNWIYTVLVDEEF
jgi:hypothetical protein